MLHSEQKTREKYRLQANIRRTHEKRLLCTLIERGPLSRATLARELGVSFTGVSHLAERLLKEGYLLWDECVPTNSAGRPATRLRIAAARESFVALSFRRGHAVAARFDMGMREAARERFPYPNAFYSSPEQLYGFPLVKAACFCDFVEECVRAMAGGTPRAIMLSMPGNFVKNCRCFVSSPMSLAVRDDFLTLLREQSGVEVEMGNDSDFYAYAQKRPGQGNTYAFININTGVGAGVLQNGKLFRSGPRHATEIGHVSIDYRGRSCTCGSRGCLEQYISFGAIAENASTAWGRPTSIQQVMQAFHEGDATAREVMRAVAEKLSFGLSGMMSVFELPRLILAAASNALATAFWSCFGGSWPRTPDTRCAMWRYSTPTPRRWTIWRARSAII